MRFLVPGFAIALAAGAPATGVLASVVQPCAQPLQSVRLGQEEQWLQQCAAAQRAKRGPGFDAIGVCRDWLTACKKNPRHPLPPGVNSF